MKYSRKFGLLAVLFWAVVAMAPSAVVADDSELFISRVWPNVLLMIDRSYSMDESAGTGASTSIGNLDGTGTSGSRMDALWKVVYTLLNADLSIPAGSGGTTTTRVKCDAREYNGDDSIQAGTPLSNMRLKCDNNRWSLLPSTGRITISRRGRSDTVTYTSKGTCPGGHGSCVFFSTPVTLTFDHRKEDDVVYSGTTATGYYFTLPYPSPSSPAGSGTFPSPNAQAIGPYHITPAPNLTSDDELKLKARIGLLDFNGTLSPYQTNINIRNQVSSTSPDEAPFAYPIRYRDLWQSIVSYATPGTGGLYTPTAQSLMSAKNFFQDAYNADDACRPNYAILITDGEDTMGLNASEDGTTSSPNNAGQLIRHNRVIEKAAALWDNTYKISLFTVGVGIGVPGETGSTSAIMYKRESREVLRRAADQLNEQLDSAQVVYVNNNGDNVLKGAGNAGGGRLGQAFFANDATQLAAALGNIFEQISEGNYVFTSPTVSSVRTSDRNYLFMGTFQPESPPRTLWEGHLYSYSINSVDNLTFRWDTDNVLASTSAANRRMYTSSVSGSTWTRQLFTTTNSYIDNNLLLVSSSGVKDNVVNYVRGTSRTLKLGDIFHSKPVLVGEPSPFYSDEGYSTGVPTGTTSFLAANKHRDRVVYAGANDGTLHGFTAGTWSADTGYSHGTGEELFAYVPKVLLRSIKNFLPTTTSSHRYWVDSSPRVADVWIDSLSSPDNIKQTSEWKTVMVTGLRKGGAGYFALDITAPSGVSSTPDANYPKVMWEYDNASILGDTWSEPYIAKVRIRNQGSGSATETAVRDRWVAIFGGGSSDSGDIGRTLLVLDIATGTPLKVFTGLDNEVAASPTAVLDAGGYIRYIYVTDIGGNLYRFDLRLTGTKDTSMPEWSYYKVFAPNAGGQPAYHRAEVATLTESQRWIYFGTGNQDFPVSDGGSGKFFGIRNSDIDNTTITEDLLTALTTENINATTGTSVGEFGWMLNLGAIESTAGVDTASHVGEKVLSDPVVFSGNVYFTTYAPISTNPCAGGGYSRLYGLNYQTGGAAMAPDTGQTAVAGSTTVSRHVYGRDLGVASSPTLSINPAGQSSLFVGFSGIAGTTGSVKEILVESPAKYKSIKSWKEIL
ncbi:MAG: PilC/PilY family type IV pilus protein [bacterium]|jgi:type IV pilus assembly protein PilY1